MPLLIAGSLEKIYHLSLPFMNTVFLLLGSNIGNRLKWFQEGIKQLSATCGNIRQKSLIYETAAWGKEDQPAFLNMVLIIETELSIFDLFKNIQEIEKISGRQRTVKWAQRTLDIDILFFNDEMIDTDDLKIPHPALQERRFTLLPLNEIIPDFIHPKIKKSIAVLLKECNDPLAVKSVGKMQ